MNTIEIAEKIEDQDGLQELIPAWTVYEIDDYENDPQFFTNYEEAYAAYQEKKETAQNFVYCEEITLDETDIAIDEVPVDVLKQALNEYNNQ